MCSVLSHASSYSVFPFQLDKKVENYVIELPLLKNETQEVTTQIKQLSQEVDKYKRATESISVNNRDALKKIESLSDELVDEEEVNKLFSDKQKIEQELKEIEEHKTATHARLLSNQQMRDELQITIAEAQKLIDFLNLEPVLKQKAQQEATIDDMKDFQTKLLKIQEDLTLLMKDFDKQVKATQKQIATKKKKIKMQQKKCQAVHKENVKQRQVLVKAKEELEEEMTELEKSKKEMELVLILGEQTLEYLSKGYVSVVCSKTAWDPML